jgi:hypothetical protein
VLTGLISAFMLMGSVMTMSMTAEQAAKDPMFIKYGYPFEAMLYIGLALLISTILYLIPKTTVLGAILLTGYLGGACATHVRSGDSLYFVFFPVVFGILVWLSLYFRIAALRTLVPLRCSWRKTCGHLKQA